MSWHNLKKHSLFELFILHTHSLNVKTLQILTSLSPSFMFTERAGEGFTINNQSFRLLFLPLHLLMVNVSNWYKQQYLVYSNFINIVSKYGARQNRQKVVVSLAQVLYSKIFKILDRYAGCIHRTVRNWKFSPKRKSWSAL